MSRKQNTAKDQEKSAFLDNQYRFGFSTDIENMDFPLGLSEEVIRQLWAIKEEPEFVLKFRLRAYQAFCKMQRPMWADVHYTPENLNEIRFYSAPKTLGGGGQKRSLEDVDQEILDTFEKLGIPLSEQKRLTGVAVDAVFDSVSVGTTHTEELKKHGVIFCSLNEALQDHPELVQKWLGKVVPINDNYYASLNSAVFSDGSFCYIPKGVKCPLDLSTYFRINSAGSGQFERTLIVADEGSSVNYLEGCTAPMRDENQLHAAVVEIVALDNATVNYSTVQNWYGGDKEGKGGIYNFVTKRGLCKGKNSKITWTQVEAGSAVTWKYPSVILEGDDSVGEFYSVALTNHKMQADTGTKMIHIGQNTSSKIISKGISCDESKNIYRGLVKIGPRALGARNYTQCDSMLVGDRSQAITLPTIQAAGNQTATVEHEATTSKISQDQLDYLRSRGLASEQAIELIINGFCREVFKELPLEFSVEAVKLLEMKLEQSVG